MLVAWAFYIERQWLSLFSVLILNANNIIVQCFFILLLYYHKMLYYANTFSEYWGVRNTSHIIPSHWLYRACNDWMKGDSCSTKLHWYLPYCCPLYLFYVLYSVKVSSISLQITRSLCKVLLVPSWWLWFQYRHMCNLFHGTFTFIELFPLWEDVGISFRLCQNTRVIWKFSSIKT